MVSDEFHVRHIHAIHIDLDAILEIYSGSLFLHSYLMFSFLGGLLSRRFSS